MHIWIYLHILVCSCLYILFLRIICTYTFMYMCICMYAYVYVCIHVYMYIAARYLCQPYPGHMAVYNVPSVGPADQETDDEYTFELANCSDPNFPLESPWNIPGAPNSPIYML